MIEESWRLRLLENIGFRKDVTDEVIGLIFGRGTKIGDKVAGSLLKEPFVHILTDGKTVRILKRYRVTQEQIKQVELVTGLKFEKANKGIEQKIWIKY